MSDGRCGSTGPDRAGRSRTDEERIDFAMTELVSLQRGEFNAASKKFSIGGVGTILLIAAAVLALFGARIFLFQFFTMPSGSMVPTLLNGDYVIVSKYPYGFSHYSLPEFLDIAPTAMPGRLFGAEPRRGDVVVFKFPGDGESDYIKRIVGLPGDKVQMIHGRLSINGTIVERSPLPPYSIPDELGPPVDHFEETLPGGVKYEIIQIDGEAAARGKTGDGRFDFNNTGIYQVPPGHYFTLGDNRDNSLDSRVMPEQGGVGYVPFENLIGRAEMVIFSVDDSDEARAESVSPWSIRWNRLFHSVH
jgi:signal peptidase I